MTTRTSWTVEQVDSTNEILPSYRATCAHCEWTRTIYGSMHVAAADASQHWRTHHAHEYFEWAARVRAEVNAT